MTLYFFLGRQHDISIAELKVVLQRFQPSNAPVHVTEVIPGIVSADVDASVTAQSLMDTLGGIVKIAEPIDVIPSIQSEDIEKRLATYLVSTETDKNRKTFCIGEHNRNHLEAVSAIAIKKSLVKSGISARFIEVPREGAEAGLLLEGGIVELHVIHDRDKTRIARTLAIQDVHNWSHRDMDKPYRDKKKGMIPPKLARTMINLAVGARQPKGMTLFDPFCGTGTILMEGALLGMTVSGSDLARDAVHGAGENLQWLIKEYGEKFALSENFRLSNQDATQVTTQETGCKVDCIVTEPFLGKQNVLPGEVDNMMKGLEKLYLGAFKQWKSILNPGGIVCIVFPVVSIEKSVKTVQNTIDRLESLGYTRENGQYLYTKLHATVQRAIYVYRLE